LVPLNDFSHNADALFAVIVPVADWLEIPATVNVNVVLFGTDAIRHLPLSPLGDAPDTCTTGPVSPSIANPWPVLTVPVATLSTTTRLFSETDPKPFTKHESNTEISDPAVPERAGAPAIDESK
jgi:hypothetical protein